MENVLLKQHPLTFEWFFIETTPFEGCNHEGPHKQNIHISYLKYVELTIPDDLSAKDV